MHDSDYNRGTDISLQAYLLNMLIHSQRCRLHLAYLTSGPKDNPAYAASREMCLNSARRIIRGEMQFLHSQHPFVQVRLRLAVILYGIFMASIILLMDVCVNRPFALDDEIHEGDLANELRMIKDVRTYSLAAASLHESLSKIVTRHREQQRQGAVAVAGNFRQQTQAETQRNTLCPPSPALVADDVLEWNNLGASRGETFSETSQLLHDTDDPMNLDLVQWEDLFSGLASSPFFGAA